MKWTCSDVHFKNGGSHVPRQCHAQWISMSQNVPCTCHKTKQNVLKTFKFGWLICFDQGLSGVGSRPARFQGFCFADVPKCPQKKSHVPKLVPECPKHCWNVPKLKKGQCFVIVFLIQFVEIIVLKCPHVPTSL